MAATDNPRPCADCQYFHGWCSNSKSPHYQRNVSPVGSCKAFFRAEQKAPLFLIALNGLMSGILSALRKEK